MVSVIAIYARQSIDKKDSISIESQIEMCKKECGSEATKIYSDKGLKRIFFEYSGEDVSLGMIAKELSEEGISCMKRKTWDNVAISRILHNPVYVEATADVYKYYRGKGVSFSNPVDFYTGETSAHIVGRRSASSRKYTKLENHVVSLSNFPGTIPADIWLKCQHKLDNNKQIKNTGKGTLSWLSGYIKCGKCGHSLAIRKYNDQLYLHCSGCTNLHLCDVKSYSITISEIEAAVQLELENVINECTLDKTCAFLHRPKTNRKIGLEKIDQKIEKLIASLTEASDISMKYINNEIEKLDKKRNELLKNLDHPNTEVPNKFKDVIFSQLSFNEKKLVVSQFIEKILVFEDEIEFVWKVRV